jgi:hypothetical protein
MMRPRFLDSESRRDLIELARDGSIPHRLARRANALVLLDDGMNCAAVARCCSSTTTRSGPGTNYIRKTGSKACLVSAMKAVCAGLRRSSRTK